MPRGEEFAGQPFCPSSPKSLQKGSSRTQCQKLAPAGFVRGSTLRWQPTHKVPSMAAPPSCLFTFIPTRGIVTIVCNISWKNESWAFCLPSAGKLCHISSSNARPPAPLPRIPAGPFMQGAGLASLKLVNVAAFLASSNLGCREGVVPHVQKPGWISDQGVVSKLRHPKDNPVPIGLLPSCALSCDI